MYILFIFLNVAHSAAALKNEEDHCKLNQKGEGEVGKVRGGVGWGAFGTGSKMT